MRWTRLGVYAQALVLVLVMAACGGGTIGAVDDGTPDVAAPSTAPEPELPVQVPSVGGDPVTVSDVSRIVPLTGSLAEIVFSVGLGDNVVGRDISTTFAAAADLPLVTRSHDVSAESVLSLSPTLVLAQTDTGPPEALEQVRSAGVPVVVFDMPTSVDGIGARVREVAGSLGVPEAGESLAADVSAEIAAVQESIPASARREPPTVAFLYMRGQAGVYLIAGPGSGADSMISAAGGIDAGTAMGLDNPFTPLTSEALVTAAPDVILMTTTGLESVGGLDGLLDIPGIAQTPAGRDGRVVTAEDGLLYSFGTRTPAALADLIAGIHARTSP